MFVRGAKISSWLLAASSVGALHLKAKSPTHPKTAEDGVEPGPPISKVLTSSDESKYSETSPKSAEALHVSDTRRGVEIEVVHSDDTSSESTEQIFIEVPESGWNSAANIFLFSLPDRSGSTPDSSLERTASSGSKKLRKVSRTKFKQFKIKILI